MARSYSIAAGGFSGAQAQRFPACGTALRLAAMQLDMAHLGFGGFHLVEAALDRAIAAGLTLEQFQAELSTA